mgnify:CR=1 FL=1
MSCLCHCCDNFLISDYQHDLKRIINLEDIDLNDEDNDGWTVFTITCKEGHQEVVKLFWIIQTVKPLV